MSVKLTVTCDLPTGSIVSIKGSSFDGLYDVASSDSGGTVLESPAPPTPKPRGSSRNVRRPPPWKLKLRDAKRAAPCKHDIYLAHDMTRQVEHKNEAYCACHPNYQCLLCREVFIPGAGSFRRVTR